MTEADTPAGQAQAPATPQELQNTAGHLRSPTRSQLRPTTVRRRPQTLFHLRRWPELGSLRSQPPHPLQFTGRGRRRRPQTIRCRRPGMVGHLQAAAIRAPRFTGRFLQIAFSAWDESSRGKLGEGTRRAKVVPSAVGIRTALVILAELGLIGWVPLAPRGRREVTAAQTTPATRSGAVRKCDVQEHLRSRR